MDSVGKCCLEVFDDTSKNGKVGVISNGVEGAVVDSMVSDVVTNVFVFVGITVFVGWILVVAESILAEFIVVAVIVAEGPKYTIEDLVRTIGLSVIPETIFVFVTLFTTVLVTVTVVGLVSTLVGKG